jgi:hypothetical protein
MFSVLLISALLAVTGPFDQTLKVAPLPRDGQVLVSFKLQQELTEEVRTTIRSGMAVSFVYKIDLRRSSAVWVDRTLATTVVRATVRYDNLTRRYLLTRTLDNRPERPDTTDSEEVAWRWLTDQFDRLPLFSSEYYVRVSAHAAPRNAGFVWPWRGDDVSAFTRFTLIR